MPAKITPLSAKQTDIDTLLKQLPDDFDKTIKIRIGNNKPIRIDGLNKTLNKEDGPADVTIHFSSNEDFYALIKKKLDVMQAVITGKIRISGDIKAAMQLQSLIGNK